MIKFMAYTLFALLIVLDGLWTFGAIEFLPNLTPVLRQLLLAILAVSGLLLLIKRLRFLGLSCIILTSITVLICFFAVEAKNDRSWEASVAVLPTVEQVSENVFKFKNVRNFHYTSENDFVAEYYDKTVDLNQLSSVDFLVSYWAGKELAHIMVSFGFAEKDFLTFSIETRKEATETYSTFAGFFRNYELIYVVADERDVIGLRTTIRNPNEQVHLLRTRMIPERRKKLFLQYVAHINSIPEKPEFYNTLTTNCTTQILRLIQTYNKSIQYNWKIFLSGYLPELLYETNAVDTTIPFEQLFAESKINERANLDITGSDFSMRIRQGLKQPEPLMAVAD
jgi:hypothetical protein